MQKIVINACFGGFGLSHEGVMRYAELAGFKIYAFQDDRVDGNISFDKQIPYNGTGKEPFIVHYSKTDKLKNNKIPNDFYWSDRDISRSDPHLVKLVEEMGDKVNGRCAELRIVEIPDKVKWVIEEYDGSEHVAEEHRTWR